MTLWRAAGYHDPYGTNLHSHGIHGPTGKGLCAHAVVLSAAATHAFKPALADPPVSHIILLGLAQPIQEAGSPNVYVMFVAFAGLYNQSMNITYDG